MPQHISGENGAAFAEGHVRYISLFSNNNVYLIVAYSLDFINKHNSIIRIGNFDGLYYLEGLVIFSAYKHQSAVIKRRCIYFIVLICR
jgi:hypothetical protein